MSEADTPNNQPLPEPTASTDDSAADWQDATDTAEVSQIANFAIEPSEQDLPLELDSTAIVLSLPETDDSTTETRTKDADWFALVQKMRQRHRRLLDQMTDVRQALKEKQEALHLEQLRSHEQEALLLQQNDEIKTLHEQLARLFHALESSHQAAQRQQILIETLTEQLQSSQERVAQLERECAFVQQRYNEQSHQLLQAADTCRELRTRLQRQQRQTLQFKVALEKSLEMTNSSNSETPQQPRQKSGIGTPSFVPKAQPIQPWSAEPESESREDLSSFETLWKRPIRLEPLSTESFSLAEPFEIRRIEEPNLASTAQTSNAVEINSTSSQDSEATELEVERQLLAEMTSLAQASGLAEFQSELADVQANLIPQLEPSPENPDEPTPSLADAEETPPLEASYELTMEAEALTEDLWEDVSDRDPEQPDEVILPQSNWPSPVLYPLRPPKKRKSLSAIDLPSFPRYRPS